jgi:hypothetical protein
MRGPGEYPIGALLPTNEDDTINIAEPIRFWVVVSDRAADDALHFAGAVLAVLASLRSAFQHSARRSKYRPSVPCSQLLGSQK